MVTISNKVVNFAVKRNFTGIVLRKETTKFGWAGCRDIIRGEFIKNEDEKLDSSLMYRVEEYKGIRVFIPSDIMYFPEKERIEIVSNISFFNMMILSVEIFSL